MSLAKKSSAEKAFHHIEKVRSGLYAAEREYGTILPRHLKAEGPAQAIKCKALLDSTIAAVHKLRDEAYALQKDPSFFD